MYYYFEALEVGWLERAVATDSIKINIIKDK